MSVRRRLTATLFGGAALGSTAYIAATTVSGLAVEEITGSAALAGLPSAVAVMGTAAGASLLTMRIAERGRRPGLITGYVVAVAGAAIAFAALTVASVWLLLVGMATMGLGHASNLLARYTGAGLFPPERRATALSLIVWAGTIGSVLGPILLAPGGALTQARGYSELAGGYVITFAFMGAAALLYFFALRPDPSSLGFDPPSMDRKPAFGDVFSRPHVKVALAALVSGQVVMVLIMVATPLHIHHHGSDLGTVGLVMSAHTLGMFGFSPLTGRLADRYGGYRTIMSGLAILALSAVLAAIAPADSTLVLLVALFLLGVGWNFGFVAGSALLTVGSSPELRARLQGRADSITWLSSAVASVTSGMLFQFADYRILAIAGLVILLVPVAVVTRHRGSLAFAAA